jgi:HD-like signal output (HDOD) protein
MEGKAGVRNAMSQSSVISRVGPKEPTETCWDPTKIPPFPAIALKALNMLGGKDTSLLNLCDLIRSDPAVSIAVLQIANSPLIAFPKSVTSVLQASMLLGFRRLRSIVITVGLKSYLANSFTPLMTACWRHSVATAIIAERSATWSFLDTDFAYTAGILHDIGRVALATLMPSSYGCVVERVADHALQVLQIEQELCGIDHCQAGRALIATWGLPEPLCEIAACHHDPTQTPAGTAALIPPSCALADCLGFHVVPYRCNRGYAEVLEDFPKAARKHFPADAQEFVSEIATEIRVIESA